MSYFSHHPEAYDEIEVKGVVDKLLSYFDDDDTDDELRERLMAIMAEIQAPSQKHPKDMVLWTQLTDWASDEIASQVQCYFENLYGE